MATLTNTIGPFFCLTDVKLSEGWLEDAKADISKSTTYSKLEIADFYQVSEGVWRIAIPAKWLELPTRYQSLVIVWVQILAGISNLSRISFKDLATATDKWEGYCYQLGSYLTKIEAGHKNAVQFFHFPIPEGYTNMNVLNPPLIGDWRSHLESLELDIAYLDNASSDNFVYQGESDQRVELLKHPDSSVRYNQPKKLSCLIRY